ncbi:MAG: hypothetical protein ACE5MH_00125, partial [Terriglobia bacterium]
MTPPLPPTSAEPLPSRNIFYDATLRPLTRRQKLLVRLTAWVGYWLIALVGRTPIGRIVLGTTNEEKARELKDLLGILPVELIELEQLGKVPPV